MSRKSWVQDPKTGKLIPKEEYRNEPTGHYVQGDIEPFVSPIDKGVISSRSQLRVHNARHGVTDSRDYSHDFMLKRSQQRVAEMTGQTKEAKNERRDLIRRAIDGYL